MGYRTLRACLDDLEATGQLVRIEEEIDPRLEAAEVHRRVFRAGGPAIYFARVKQCSFPMVSNLFGTMDRTRFIFRDTLDVVRRLVEAHGDPAAIARRPWRNLPLVRALWHMRPRVVARGPALEHDTSVDRLPPLQSWPDDGGPFVTLPQVYTEDADRPGLRHSNLGMYRIQLSGGQYRPGEEVGLHYQIHRGIGVHHAAAMRCGEPFRVNVFVGRTLPEGPFGDHLGYYSLAHDYPVLRVERVSHRAGAVWPFTVVGRPPQEDTMFGELIHEITGPVIPRVIPGVHGVHAVDAAGVHPLLLAVGSERYTPYQSRSRPQELLTAANAILGQGQLSLAKYLWIAAREDDPNLDVQDIVAMFRHILCRVDWARDLHFQTCTTIDTLDYSGGAVNEGSKLVIAAVGPPRRQLAAEVRTLTLPDGFGPAGVCLPGVLAIGGPRYEPGDADASLAPLLAALRDASTLDGFPLVVVVDDPDFAAASLENFLWVTFTRSDPAADVHGVGQFVDRKHWGCRGSLVIDARAKPHHAPPLVEDPEVTRRVDRLAAKGGPLAGII